MRTISRLGLALVLIAAPRSMQAADLRLETENDSMLPGNDKYYTSGIRLALTLDDLRHPAFPSEQTLSVTQEMYTPAFPRYLDHLGRETTPPPGSRPHAGWLYGELAATFRHDTHTNTVGIRLGTLGPDALAEEAQDNWHNATRPTFGGANFHHWDLQVNEGATIAIVGESCATYALGAGFGASPHAFAEFGNGRVQAALGATLAWSWTETGWRTRHRSLRTSTGAAPAQLSGIYLDAETTCTARDRTLTGDAPFDWDVSRSPWLAQLSVGIRLAAGTWHGGLFYAVRTREFREQPEATVGLGGFSVGKTW